MAESIYYEAAGNRFAIVRSHDAVAAVLESPEMVELELDGVLVCTEPEGRADVRMEVVNRDGSPAQACGNGLRCIARYAFGRKLVARAMTIETASGVRRARLIGESRVRTSMGMPRIEALEEEVDGHRLAIVDLGNPHCVLFVDDVESSPVEELGRRLESHARFPGRTNVEFACAEEGGLAMRVWERGVGETAACGTGAAAAAVVALEKGLADSPVRVRLPGGVLTVSWDGRGELELEGPVARLDRRPAR